MYGLIQYNLVEQTSSKATLTTIIYIYIYSLIKKLQDNNILDRFRSIQINM
jgi:hypothetical protein